MYYHNHPEENAQEKYYFEEDNQTNRLDVNSSFAVPLRSVVASGQQ